MSEDESDKNHGPFALHETSVSKYEPKPLYTDTQLARLIPPVKKTNDVKTEGQTITDKLLAIAICFFLGSLMLSAVFIVYMR